MIRYTEAYWRDVDAALACVPNLAALRGKTVFLTGGTGLIGSAVVDLLVRFNRTQDGQVRILLGGRSRARMTARFSDATEGADFFFVPYDATDPDAEVPAADFIIHAASPADPAVLIAQPVETILSNVLGLQRLLEAARGRVLYVSSSEVYGNRPDDESERPYREEDYGFVDILDPRSAYPCAKRLAETLCVSYGHEHGLDAVMVRPGHIYGPSITETDSRASAQFTRNAAAGEDIVMKSAGTQLRSYCYVLDCASAMLTVLLGGATGQAYNISNRDSVVTIRNVADALAAAAGVQVVFEEASAQEKAGYNRMTNSSLDAGNLESLGWRAIFGLREGTERTLAFYRQE